ncbi:hypothetical protein [Nocardiopsis synnemataformans]|uniref:hypothetical protein n=1 Tax=Nocardiopsis synnemataformans TaxID=61305 RepID=UPI003EC0702B
MADKQAEESIELTPAQQETVLGWFQALLPGPENAARVFAETVAELERVNEVLHEAGFDWPQGARGVRDLAVKHSGMTEDLKRDLQQALEQLEAFRLQPSDEGNGPMTSHELARVLLAKPDLPVVVRATGKPVEFTTVYPGRVALLTGEEEVLGSSPGVC